MVLSDRLNSGFMFHMLGYRVLRKVFFFNELAYVLIVLLVGTCCTLILFLHCSCQANLDYSWWYGKTLTDFFFLLSILLPPFTRSNMQSTLFNPSPFMEQWLFQRWTRSEPCKVIGDWQVALSIKYQWTVSNYYEKWEDNKMNEKLKIIENTKTESQ